MTKIKNRDITDRFIAAFEQGKPFTPSEKRMIGIKLSHLRKSVNQYIEDNAVETELSVNEMIMDAIEYSVMIGMKFRSIASLGYDVLPKSIEYWKKRRVLEEHQNTESMQQEENYNQIKEKVIDKGIEESYNKSNNKPKTPSWLNVDSW
jgi:hypothetical protein